jgi:hypothetical protein
MNQVGTYNFRDYQISRFFFTGTATLQAGQPLCFKSTPTTGPVPTTVTVTSPNTSGWVKGFPFDVDLPSSSTTQGPSGNMRRVAGIVAPQSVGATGPCYIDVIVPRRNDILQVLVGNLAADLTAGDLLMLDVSIGTGIASTLAAFDPFTVVSSADYNATQLAVFVKTWPLAQALESLASTAVSTLGQRQLVWVKFQ